MKKIMIILIVALAICDVTIAQKKEKKSISNAQEINGNELTELRKTLKNNPDISIEKIGNDQVISSADYWIEDIKGNQIRFDTSYVFNKKIFSLSINDKESSYSEIYSYYNDTTPHVYIEGLIFKGKDTSKPFLTIKALVDGTSKGILAVAEINSMIIRIGDISQKSDSTQTGSDSNADDISEQGTITNTGVTKIVCGETCEEYLLSSWEGETIGRIWIAHDISTNIPKALISNDIYPGYSDFTGYDAIKDGLLMAADIQNQKNESWLRTEIKEIQSEIMDSISTRKFYTKKHMQIPFAQLIRTYKCESGREITVPLIIIDNRKTAGQEFVEMELQMINLRSFINGLP